MLINTQRTLLLALKWTTTETTTITPHNDNNDIMMKTIRQLASPVLFCLYLSKLALLIWCQLPIENNGSELIFGQVGDIGKTLTLTHQGFFVFLIAVQLQQVN